jgi:hypothetical protein
MKDGNGAYGGISYTIHIWLIYSISGNIQWFGPWTVINILKINSVFNVSQTPLMPRVRFRLMQRVRLTIACIRSQFQITDHYDARVS